MASQTWNIIVAVAAGVGSLLSVILAIIHFVNWLRKRTGVVDVIFHHRPVLGFAAWGPAMQVTMTLKAEKRDVFIKGMTLEVVRLKDKATHTMNWLLTLSGRRDVKKGDLSPIEGELAGGFSVLPQQPRMTEILFHDREVYESIIKIREELGEVFQKWADKKGYNSDETALNPQLAKTIAKEFNSQRNSSFFSKTVDLFYFKPSDYECILKIVLKKGYIEKRFRFSLDEKKSKRLELNCVWVSKIFPPGETPTFFFESPKADYSP